MSQNTIEPTVSEVSEQDKYYSRQEIESLVGFESDPASVDVSDNATTDTHQNEESELLEEGDFEEEVATKRQVWQIWWVKLLMVAMPLGVVAFIVGAIFTGITGEKTVAEEDDVGPVAEEVEDPAELEARRTEQEIAELKTANALGNQASVLNSQQPQAEIRSRPTQTVSQEPSRTINEDRVTTKPSQAPASSPEAVRVRPVPAPRPVQRPVPSYYCAKTCSYSCTETCPCHRCCTKTYSCAVTG